MKILGLNVCEKQNNITDLKSMWRCNGSIGITIEEEKRSKICVCCEEQIKNASMARRILTLEVMWRIGSSTGWSGNLFFIMKWENKRILFMEFQFEHGWMRCYSVWRTSFWTKKVKQVSISASSFGIGKIFSVIYDFFEFLAYLCRAGGQPTRAVRFRVANSETDLKDMARSKSFEPKIMVKNSGGFPSQLRNAKKGPINIDNIMPLFKIWEKISHFVYCLENVTKWSGRRCFISLLL